MEKTRELFCEYKKKFAKILKKLREEKRLNQSQLAEKLKINKSSIGKYEAGIFMPKMKNIINLARFFDVSTNYILGLDD